MAVAGTSVSQLQSQLDAVNTAIDNRLAGGEALRSGSSDGVQFANEPLEALIKLRDKLEYRLKLADGTAPRNVRGRVAWLGRGRSG